MSPIRHRLSRLGIAALALSALAGFASSAHALAGHILENNRLFVEFGNPGTGYTAADTERVDEVRWLNSDGTAVTDYVADGGPTHCGDPQEFFGEAYGDYGTTGDVGVPIPLAVIGGVTSVWNSASILKGTAVIGSLASCDATLDAKTTTHYILSTLANLIDSLKISRTFHFSRHANDGNLRAYVPRLPLSTYPVVYAPNALGVVQSYNVQTYNGNGCPVNCTITDWNGKWFADDDGSGNGMAVFRNATTNPPAQLTLDYDGDSSSNNTAVTLIEPAGGWSRTTVTEVEYLCFYDAKSWPTKRRNAGLPPIGCAGVPH